MVSTQTAVLPVLRSPMISWRWPRPIGVMRVDGLDAGLQRLADALALHHRRGLQFQRATGVGLDVALAVDRLAERVDHAAEEGVADRHREHLAGALDLLALFDLLEVTEDHRADAVLVEVQRHTEHATGELEQLLRHHRGQALDVGDAVAGVDDGADLFALGVGGEARRRSPRSRLRCQQPRLSTLPWLFVFLPLCCRWCSRCRWSSPAVRSGPRSAGTRWRRRSPRRRRRSASPPSNCRIDVQLDRHRVAVDAGEHLGEPGALSVATGRRPQSRGRRPRRGGPPRVRPGR